ncbi:heat-inducible transcriptional repressor HrcA [Weissella oryzae SG25]|uniref:Heat-inducible transcription repressor HrcA n=1 Tax=Weissella oryzae (strain DSM 25784 / JCM 18191 / LMG 30913 / SG25) TaxID=1329250 RepID=A0A069CZF1_WEIOS|nr:heat-inducible transcriptional repressor HrcA [Weissella oryzae]GAK30461.1 heat-inducible transcriptional repressor HrcA [Weissella oryzae SG25]
MLTDRQKLILAAIIRDYVRSGKAVGSKRLLSELDLAVSTATIRNEMASLEEDGLLQKEHTSSGRVPSQMGYRYYVDELLREPGLDQEIQSALNHVFERNFQQIDDLIDRMVHEMANLTGFTVFALKPEVLDVRLSGFRLVPLNNNQVMAIIVNSDGQVTSQSFQLPTRTSLDDLSSMVRYINETLVNQPVREILMTLSGDLPLKMERMIRTPMAFLQLFGDVLARSIRDLVFTGGRLNLLDFSDDKKLLDIKQLYQLLENPVAMRKIITNANEGVMIQIGDENSLSLLAPYSLVSATYRVPQLGMGALAILGPTNMPYGEIITIVDTFRQALAQKIFAYYH